MKFKQGVDEFLDYVKVTKSDGTYDFYYRFCQALCAYIDTDLDEIDRKLVINFISQKKKDNPDITNRTINKYILTIKRVVEYNTGRNLTFDKLNEVTKVIETVPPEVSRKIFTYFQVNLGLYKEALRNLAFFKLLLDTGLRLSEALKLKVRDMDFQSSSIHVKITKTSNERYVFFTKPTATILHRLISDHRLSDWLFMNYKQNKRLSVNNVQKMVSRLTEALNLSVSVSPHRWRHTFATNFLKNGGDLETLRMLMGHSSLKTTQRYLHLKKEDISQAYFRINGDTE